MTQPHLFAHSQGDLFWWVSHGMDEGVMPGFADVLNRNQRWDVIDFIGARAAGALAGEMGPEVATAIFTGSARFSPSKPETHRER